MSRLIEQPDGMLSLLKVSNRYGRRGGRGWRPYLLIPKYLGVCLFLGGLVAMLAVGIAFRPDERSGVEAWRDWRVATEAMSIIIRFTTVPGLLMAMMCGSVLLYIHGLPVWRMRWIRVKLAAIAISIPALHFYLSGKLAVMRMFAREVSGNGKTVDFSRGTGDIAWYLGVLSLGIVVTTCIIVLGRHKPRLGQSVATLTRTTGKDKS